MKTRLNFALRTFLMALLIGSSTLANSQCIITHATNSPWSTYNNPGPNLYGQSFTAECNGDMEYFEVVSTSAGTVTSATFKIFDGITVSGTPMYSQVHPDIVVANGNDPIRFDITGAVPLIQGNYYTFEFSISLVDIKFETDGDYSGGYLWENGNASIFSNLFFTVSSLGTADLNEQAFSKDEKVISPNPANDFVQISGLGQSDDYRIFNVMGNEVAQGNVDLNEKVDVSQFESGIYFLKLEDGTNLRFVID